MLPLSDDFNNGTIDAQWTAKANTGMGVAATGGVLQVTWPAAPSGVLFAGLASSTTYDLSACSAFVQVTQVPNTSTDGYLTFNADDNGDTLEFFIDAGTLYAFLWQGANPTQLATTTFDTATNGWLRLRTAGGTVFWETSGDGLNWSAFASAAAPFSLTSMTLTIGGGTYQTETSPPGTAAFDNFDVAP